MHGCRPHSIVNFMRGRDLMRLHASPSLALPAKKKSELERSRLAAATPWAPHLDLLLRSPFKAKLYFEHHYCRIGYLAPMLSKIVKDRGRNQRSLSHLSWGWLIASSYSKPNHNPKLFPSLRLRQKYHFLLTSATVVLAQARNLDVFCFCPLHMQSISSSLS